MIEKVQEVSNVRPQREAINNWIWTELYIINFAYVVFTAERKPT